MTQIQCHEHTDRHLRLCGIGLVLFQRHAKILASDKETGLYCMNKTMEAPFESGAAESKAEALQHAPPQLEHVYKVQWTSRNERGRRAHMASADVVRAAVRVGSRGRLAKLSFR